jgi:hypothetical protein
MIVCICSRHSLSHASAMPWLSQRHCAVLGLGIADWADMSQSQVERRVRGIPYPGAFLCPYISTGFTFCLNLKKMLACELWWHLKKGQTVDSFWKTRVIHNCSIYKLVDYCHLIFPYVLLCCVLMFFNASFAAGTCSVWPCWSFDSYWRSWASR